MNLGTSQIPTKCKNAFSKYQDSSCVVYNDIDCDDKGFGIGLMTGVRKNFAPEARINNVSLQNNIKAISVQQGCSIQMFTGKLSFTVISVYFYIFQYY